MVKFGRGDTSLPIISASIAEIFAVAAEHCKIPQPAELDEVMVDSATPENPIGSDQPSVDGGEYNYSSLAELDEILSALEGALI